MDDTDDYESEILFYSVQNNKRLRDNLKRKFYCLVITLCLICAALAMFDLFRTKNSKSSNNNVIKSIDTLIDDLPLDQLDLPYVNKPLMNGEQRCQQPSYDYLQLAVRWPSSLCLFHHCNQTPDNWIIYSLKPTFYNGTVANSCCSVSDFDTDRIAPLESLLSTRWPAMFNTNQWKESMKRQFDRYGSCLGSGMSMAEQQRNRNSLSTSVPIQLHFVDVVRRLVQWLPDIKHRLQQAQLIPQLNVDNLYALNSIGPALAFNKSINIQCSRYRSAGREYSLLDTIVICFDRYSLQLLDCPNVLDDCPERILYPHPKAKLFNNFH